MDASHPWKDKLPSIAGTLAMQAAIAALLLFSITAVRRQMEETVTTLFLASSPKPVTIDARQPPPRKVPREEAATAPPLPAYAAPSASLSLPAAPGSSALPGLLGRQAEACRIEARETAAHCPPSNLARRDDRVLSLDQAAPVKNEAIWQREAERKRVASAQVSLSDPKAIGLGLDAPALPGMTGAERLQLRRYYSPQTSRGGTDWENRVRWDSARALGYD